MSTFEEVSGATNNQRFTNYNTAKVCMGGNTFETGEYTNGDSYDAVTLAEGLVIGRVAATGALVPAESDASDGSQFPIGVLPEAVVVAAGDTVNLSVCVSGRVREDMITFSKEGDDLDTVVSSKQYRDRLASDTLGLKVTPCANLSEYDNQ